MIVAKNKSFPTQFAILIATSCDLYVPPEEEIGNEELWRDLRDRLENFQKMSISQTFETSMIAYYDFDEMSEHQTDQLKLIHKSTADWLHGHITEQLLEKLGSSLTNGREAREIAEWIHETTNKNSSPKDKQTKKKSLLVRFANLPPDTKIKETEDE